MTLEVNLIETVPSAKFI